MNSKMLSLLRILLSVGYCYGIGVILWILTDLTMLTGMLLGAFATLISALLMMSSGGTSMPVMRQSTNTTSIDANDLRVNIEVNTEVAKAEKSFLFKEKQSHVERRSYWRDLIYRRAAWELIVAALVAGMIAFSPYIKYFIS